MNARSYRIEIKTSPLDFPAVDGIVESSVIYQSEPTLKNNKLLLSITNSFIMHNIDNKKQHQVLSVQAIYDIPLTEINTRADVYEFYKDAILSLDEVYKYAQTQMRLLPSRLFPNQPIENYDTEINRVFNLLNSRN